MPAKLLTHPGEWTSLGMYVGRVLVPYVAVLTSFLFAVAPLPDIRRIRTAKSTLQFPFAPFFCYMMQCIMFLLYAYVTSNPLLATTMSVGSVLGSYYVSIYYTYSKQKSHAHRFFACGICLYIVLLHGAMVKSTEEAKTLIGVPGNVLMVLTAVSPLFKVREIIRRKDASSLPVGMSIMNVIAGAVWTLYGFMLDDIVVIFPNIITTIVGLVQVSLIAIYRNPPMDKHIVRVDYLSTYPFSFPNSKAIMDDEEHGKACYVSAPPTPIHANAVHSQRRPSDLLKSFLGQTPKVHTCLYQLATALVFFLAFIGAQTYIWYRSTPFFASFIMLVCSWEFFWLSHYSTRTLTAPLNPNETSDSVPWCGQVVADRFLRGRLFLLAGVVSLGVAGIYYTIAINSLLVLRSPDGPLYRRTIIGLSTFTGGISTFLSFYCPSWLAALSLICLGAFFLIVSIDTIAFQLSVLTRSFLVDNGELYAQGGCLLIVLAIFPRTPPIVSLLTVCHHLVGFIYVFGCSSAISGYIEHENEYVAVHLLMGIQWTTAGACFVQCLWHILLEQKYQWRFNLQLVPCLDSDSPNLYDVIASCLGGFIGMLLACLYVDIVGTWEEKLIYTFLAVSIANFGRPFLLVFKKMSGGTSSTRLLDGLQLFLPLILLFSPYYRVHIGAAAAQALNRNNTLRH